MPYSVTLWGTRGSIPTPGPRTIRHGGNTPCVTLDRDGVPHIILDAGSGLRVLGRRLMEQDGWAETVLLLTHTHWDHIQGLPFFQPLAVRDFTLRIYGAAQEGVPLAKVLESQMHPSVFPIPLSSAAAALSVTEVGEEPFRTQGVDVTPFRLCHPGTTLGFRLQPPGARSVAYVTDNELGAGGASRRDDGWRARFGAWLAGTDTLLHDAMYRDAEITARAGWGHSSTGEAVDVAVEAGCRRLVLFHHEPEHDDDTLDAERDAAERHARRLGSALEVITASEGARLEL